MLTYFTNTFYNNVKYVLAVMFQSAHTHEELSRLPSSQTMHALAFTCLRVYKLVFCKKLLSTLAPFHLSGMEKQRQGVEKYAEDMKKKTF